MRTFTLLAAIFALVLAAAPFGSASSSGAGGTKATTVDVKGGEFWFKLSATSVPHGVVTFVFKNVGHVPHDFRIGGRKTPIIAAGKSVTLSVRLLKAGKYAYSCTVPGHAAGGMKGVVTVT
jgi:uncharacterized cupredoxin-like copper-binding protein